MRRCTGKSYTETPLLASTSATSSGSPSTKAASRLNVETSSAPGISTSAYARSGSGERCAAQWRFLSMLRWTAPKGSARPLEVRERAFVVAGDG